MPATAGTEPNTTDGGDSGIGVLSALIPLASAIATAGTDPSSWLRMRVLEWVLDAFVIKPIAWVYGIILQGFGIAADSILDLFPILEPITRIAVDPLVNGVNGLYATVRGSLMGMGLGAPIAAAITVAIALVLLLTIVYGLWKLIPGSDSLEGITQWTS